MKKILSLVSFLAFGFLAAHAQNPTQAASGPVMTFEETTIDYGMIDKGSNGIRLFKFKNTGTEPLVIKHAKGSCGCTTPDYPKEPIMPDEEATISVKYDTNRPGPFNKTVTVTTNETVETRTLTIKGEVKIVPEAPSVPASTDGIRN